MTDGTGQRRMSDVMLEMARSVFVNPEAIPSGEALYTALHFALVAWQQSLVPSKRKGRYKSIIKDCEKSRPGFFRELRSQDPDVLIQELKTFKQATFPDDNRWIVSCEMSDEGNVHCEWTDSPPEPLRLRPKRRRMPRATITLRMTR